jgi:hypothetical protein
LIPAIVAVCCLIHQVNTPRILPNAPPAAFDRSWIACYFNPVMLGFRYLLSKMPLDCRRTFALIGASLFLLGTQTSCEEKSPTASQPTTSPVNAAPESIVGKVINFTAYSERYRVSGWSVTEDDCAWSEGTSAKLALPIPADAGPLNVKMTLRGLIQPPTLPSQPVTVYANTVRVADWQVSDTAVFTAEVPVELTKSGAGTLTLELRIPKAASPKSLGINEDGRILGVSCCAIEVSSAAAK